MSDLRSKAAAGGFVHWPQLSTSDLGLVRSPGAGLGNLLFPITRALIGQKRYQGDFLYPTMRQLKFGTYLRRERDKRTYGDNFRSRTAADWRAWRDAFRLQRINETDVSEQTCSPRLVVYTGLGRYFHDLHGGSGVISDWLEANAEQSGKIGSTYDVGMHVRLGDFAPSGVVGGGHSIRQTFDWYRRAHDLAKEMLSSDRPKTVLFSDSQPAHVAAELDLPNLDVDPSKNAVTAILNLSRARVIITSRSTFSMWAAYLGNQPAIWHEQLDLRASFPARNQLDQFLA